MGWKEYWTIPGPRDAPRGLPCIGFEKYDGSNLRYLWRKGKWVKFGTRHRLFDATDEDFGIGIELFLKKYGDSIPKAFCDTKELRSVSEATIFCEFYGEHSFAGFHEPTDPKDVILLDVCPYKKGVIGPRDFLRWFGHLHIPAVVYEGDFTESFIQDVRAGTYPVFEGVVVKGNKPNGKYPHNFWSAKVKTRKWLDELKRKSEYIEALRAMLAENEKEQG